MYKKEELKNLIKNANYIVIMTGAGFSVPSGIPDFRSINGLYSKNDSLNQNPEEILSHSYFFKHPKLFYQFYRSKMLYLNALPNIAHNIVAKLEEIGKVKAVITQNIDGLHQQAGSKNVIELHGSIHRNYCLNCGKSFHLSAMTKTNDIPICECGGIIKPDVVLYEESLNNHAIEGAIIEIEKADLLLVVGTSLLVYPAAGLLQYYRNSNLVIINKDVTPYDDCANLVIHEQLETILTYDLI